MFYLWPRKRGRERGNKLSVLGWNMDAQTGLRVHFYPRAVGLLLLLHTTIAERCFSDGFSNPTCVMFGWGIWVPKFIITMVILLITSELYSSFNNNLLQMLTLIILVQNTRQDWTFHRDARLLVWWQLVGFDGESRLKTWKIKVPLPNFKIFAQIGTKKICC